MKKHFLLLILMTLCSIVCWADGVKPNIHILATGGTIAGSGESSTGSSYKAGGLTVDMLVNAVPQISDVANITGEQISNIGSQDMTDEIMLLLAKRLNILLKSPEVDGVVITHGTDTMEETAYFLSLTVKSNKPIVLVGSMRPATSISPDGNMNLYNAVVVASSKESYGKGVLVAMNSEIFDAKYVTKTNTSSLETFKSPEIGRIGKISNGKVDFLTIPTFIHTLNSQFDITNIDKLPKVGIVYCHSSVDRVVVDAFRDNHYKGIVVAGVGNGNIHKNIFSTLVECAKDDIWVVRSSRVGSGSTALDAEINDKEFGFIAALNHNPQKSRILLMLSIATNLDYNQMQDAFAKY